MNWQLIKRISIVFIIIFLLAAAADFLLLAVTEHGRKGAGYIGCFTYDAMLVGIKCQGFIGNELVAAWLNWPFWVFYATMYSMYLTGFNIFIACAVVALAWSPLVIYVLSTIMLRRTKNA